MLINSRVWEEMQYIIDNNIESYTICEGPSTTLMQQVDWTSVQEELNEKFGFEITEEVPQNQVSVYLAIKEEQYKIQQNEINSYTDEIKKLNKKVDDLYKALVETKEHANNRITKANDFKY